MAVFHIVPETRRGLPGKLLRDTPLRARIVGGPVALNWHRNSSGGRLDRLSRQHAT